MEDQWLQSGIFCEGHHRAEQPSQRPLDQPAWKDGAEVHCNVAYQLSKHEPWQWRGESGRCFGHEETIALVLAEAQGRNHGLEPSQLGLQRHWQDAQQNCRDAPIALHEHQGLDTSALAPEEHNEPYATSPAYAEGGRHFA